MRTTESPPLGKGYIQVYTGNSKGKTTVPKPRKRGCPNSAGGAGQGSRGDIL